MTEPTSPLSLLSARVDALERQNRTYRRVALGAGGLLVLLAVMGQARPGVHREVVEAERFVVRDGTGTVRAFFGLNPNVPGQVGLVVTGRTHLSVGVNADGAAGFQLWDGTSRRMGLGIHPDGRTGLEMLDTAQKPRLRVAVTPDGAPGLRLLDASGTERAILTVPTDGSAGLLVADSTGRFRTALATQADGTTAVDLLDGAGRSRLNASAKADGAPSFALRGESGQVLFQAPSPR